MNHCISSDDLPEPKPRKAARSITLADVILKKNKKIVVSAVKKILSEQLLDRKTNIGVRSLGTKLFNYNLISKEEFDMITILGAGTLIIDFPHEPSKQYALLAISIRLLKMAENNNYTLDPSNMPK